MVNSKRIVALTLAAGMLLPVFSAPLTANAKTTYLPSAVRSHRWYQLTDGSQGGFHNKTTFKGNHMTVGHSHWSLTGLKKHSKSTYYGKLHYSKSYSQLIKVKINSSKSFWFIPKHVEGTKGNYKGNADYGAMIFKR
ncbi:hypothetical protein [Secundilactobacillus silagei]|uniref:Uncharacterized protein n=1 Tax=Secundilactobacillus silagei JCM 19001 TaxID=1302250 RepID=A0A1Z5IIK2_9LACO|nr:hypothetical protein [Secundilactobacillus silagei]TDG72893.1 hypothetical protein C5L25_002182 [Secundilactobacillus silagei JCM 19001]GAX01583.1 hypothetical protein IWT126_01625 [Secundilactobacillus silagei JCM 19001]